jgi:hypothetical protein
MAVLQRLSCPGCPFAAVLPAVVLGSCLSVTSRLYSVLSCCPVPVYCSVLNVQSHFPVQAILSPLSYHVVLPSYSGVLSMRLCSGYPTLSCPSCPVPAVLSRPITFVLNSPAPAPCPDLAAAYWPSCAFCPVPNCTFSAVRYRLSCSCYPVLGCFYMAYRSLML